MSSQNYTQKITSMVRDWWLPLAITLVTLTGVWLRIQAFLTVPPIHGGEVMLTLNLLERSFARLLDPLDYAQGAPILFLWIEKLIMSLAGSSDFSLRILPLFSAIASLILFPFLCRKYTSLLGVLWATILFAFSTKLIYYATQVKQYGVDVLGTIVVLGLYNYLSDKKIRLIDVVFASIAGICLIFLSHPALFILASAGLVLFFSSWFSGDKQKAGKIFIIGLSWMIGGLANVTLSTLVLAQHDVLQNFWDFAYPPQTYQFGPILLWLKNSFFELFRSTILQLSLVGVGAMFFIFGIFSLGKKDLPRMLSLTLALIFTLIAAFLRMYPFDGRLLLFLFPIIVILVAEGMDLLFVWAPSNYYKVPVLIIIFFLLVKPIQDGLAYNRTVKEDAAVREVYEYASSQWEEDDLILELILLNDKIGFMFWDQFPSDEQVLSSSAERREGQLEDFSILDRLARDYKRIWLIYPTDVAGGNAEEKQLILDFLESIGGQIEYEQQAPGAYGYLVNFHPDGGES